MFRSELKAAGELLAKNFDDQDKAVLEARTTLRQLLSANLRADVPDLNESLTALRNLHSGKEKK